MITRIDSSEREQKWVVYKLDPDGRQDDGCGKLCIESLR
jgi:hypothetical protein